MKSYESIREKITLLKPLLLKEYGVQRIGIFGSYANGSFTEDSDIDVVIEKGGTLGWKFFQLKDFLEDSLQKKVDLVTPDSIRKEWRRKILNEVIYL